MPCNKDRLTAILSEIQYYARYSVGRCDKNTINDLKYQTERVISIAKRDKRQDIIKRAENLLVELKDIKCWE